MICFTEQLKPCYKFHTYIICRSQPLCILIIQNAITQLYKFSSFFFDYQINAELTSSAVQLLYALLGLVILSTVIFFAFKLKPGVHPATHWSSPPVGWSEQVPNSICNV